MGVVLSVQLLGQFRICVEGHSISSQVTDRSQSLLAYLLLHAGSPQSRVHLAFVFWPDASEANGRNSLRQLIHQLRRAVPDADRYIESDANTIRWALDPSVSLDVAMFDTARAEAERAVKTGNAVLRRACLERAVDLCQGPLLPSCLDDWIIPERERLGRQCEAVTAMLVPLLEQARDYGSAIERVRHWLLHDRFDEEAQGWLIRLLALAGDRSAALQAYRQYVDLLRREFGTEPSAETVQAFERARDGSQAPRARIAKEDEPSVLPRLVGRHSEWVQIRESWERASEGRTAFVVVTGDAGIGKSRLAEELVIWAQRQGAAVAKTRSYSAEGQLSLAPVSEWLRSDALSPQLGRLDDIWRVEVARLLPELQAAPSLQRPMPVAEYGDRLRFFEGMARAVLAATPPVLLVIDDLQWCDRETLEWLHFLCRFDPRARLLVLGTVRSESFDPSHPLAMFLRQLRGTTQLEEIVLEPLDAAETAALASALTERDFDAKAAMQLYSETEGNPLFVVETVRAEAKGSSPSALQGSQPFGLTPRAYAVISGRLAQLSDDTRNVVSVASVIGRAFDARLLVQVVGNEELVTSALDELWRKRVIREQGSTAYDFTHDKLRDVAYGETSVPQRRLLHRRVAEALVALNAPALHPVSAQIAAQYESAGLLEQAIPYYLKAASVAYGLYAHDDTISLVNRGLSLLSKLPADIQSEGWELELQLALAPSYRVTKGWAAPELGSALDRALSLCDRVGTDLQRVTILYGMQSFYAVAGHLEKSAHITDELARTLGRSEGAQPSRAAFVMMAGIRILMGRFGEGSQEIEELVEQGDPAHFLHLQQSQGLNYEIHARAWQSHALWCLGVPDTAIERARDALRLARQLDQPFSQAIAATYLALLHQLQADAATFRRQAEEALEIATTFKATYYRAWCAILVAHAGTLSDPNDTHLAHLRDTIEQFKSTGARLRLPYYLALLADAYLRARCPETGLKVVEEALSRSRETNERWWDAELHRLRAELLRVNGAETGETESALRRAIEIAREQRAKSLELRAAVALARHWAALGRRQDARDLLAPLYFGFNEGLATPDLVGAANLLDSL
jgi:predicted ATPase/DNA-binding SARP family transcriptional activator